MVHGDAHRIIIGVHCTCCLCLVARREYSNLYFAAAVGHDVGLKDCCACNLGAVRLRSRFRRLRGACGGSCSILLAGKALVFCCEEPAFFLSSCRQRQHDRAEATRSQRPVCYDTQCELIAALCIARLKHALLLYVLGQLVPASLRSHFLFCTCSKVMLN